MTKEELTNIISLISERNWDPLYKEGCERAGRSPYNGYAWVASVGVYLFCDSPRYITFETKDKDLEAIAKTLDSLQVRLIHAVSNDRSDDYLCASGEPEYWEHDLGIVTYYPDGSCSDIVWVQETT